jgi:hypothetical protein
MKAALLALGRLKTGVMNKTEAAYAQRLQLMQNHGTILWWRFEAMKLRLADNTFYTADFVVLAQDSVVELHEVKGFMRDDAAVKIKVAAAIYPFRFFIVRKGTSGWTETAI